MTMFNVLLALYHQIHPVPKRISLLFLWLLGRINSARLNTSDTICRVCYTS